VSRIVFITGTDTGVGKTTVTALLLAHGLAKGEAVRAVKPLSSGERRDEELLRELQGASDEINFAHFQTPIAPWSAARRAGAEIPEEIVIEWLRRQSEKCDLLLVEGAGGLLTPLGERFSALDLIQHLEAEAIVVTRNRLGVLNQALLVLEALASRDLPPVDIALVDEETPDLSAPTNREDLIELVKPIPVVSLPFFKKLEENAEFYRCAAASLGKPLQSLLKKKNPPDTEPRGFFP
jgi:dethiobiotin synthetase